MYEPGPGVSKLHEENEWIYCDKLTVMEFSHLDLIVSSHFH